MTSKQLSIKIESDPLQETENISEPLLNLPIKREDIKLDCEENKSSLDDKKCGTCGKTFLYRKSFENHKKSCTKIRSFECTKCQKKFTQTSTLNRHVDTIHDGFKMLYKDLKQDTITGCFI